MRPLVGVYLTGAIAPADRAVVVRHLAGCADCRAELAGLAALPALLRRPPVHAAAQALEKDAPPPDNTAPESTGPENTRLESTRPDSTVLDSTERDTTALDTTALDSTALITTMLDSTALDSTGLDNTILEYTVPKYAVPGAAGAAGVATPGRLVRRMMRRRRRRRRLLATAAFALVAGAGVGWALQAAGPPAPRPDTAATILHTRNIGDVTVLTDDEGYTLYWFGPDTATKSACQGDCARNWQPVSGPVAWGPGVTGTIGAIVRPGGSLQATYDGHPLYTTAADTGPGQTKGNGVWSHGGEWHEVTVPGRGS
jgi:predicted lipoprotein with Yx(FWY)xxD motif